MTRRWLALLPTAMLAMLLAGLALSTQAAAPGRAPTGPADGPAAALVPGSRLVFQRQLGSNWEVYAANDDGTDLARLTNHNAADEYPRLNRGGTRVVFASPRGTNKYNIYAMNADGSGLEQLVSTSADDISPAWSPDSTRIAFASRRDGNWEVYAMNADGTGQARLTTDPLSDLDPAWSPDGAWVVFSSQRTGDFRIWKMDPAGGSLAMLSGEANSRRPAWSPDGTQIAFDADADGDGRKELWCMQADGSDRQLLYDPTSANEDIWVRSWSPDGRFIAFTHLYGYVDPDTWTAATMRAWDTWNPGSIVTLLGGDRDWNPDWQTSDVLPPTSAVLPLAGTSAGPFAVSWSGYDNGPAGLRSFDIQVRDGGGAWTDWLTRTAATSASYDGVGGHTYAFRSRAHDYAYNVEPYPDAPDAVTTLEDAPPQTSVSPLPRYCRGTQLLVSWGGSDPGGSGIAYYDVQVRDGAGAWTDWKPGTTATSATFTGTAGHTYFFRSRGVDGAHNVEAWPAGDGDTSVTLYTWAVSGIVRDNRDTLVAGAVVTTTPGAFEMNPSDFDGAYSAYVSTGAGSYQALWGHADYGTIPATSFSAAQDASFDVFLPPADNAVLNWGFETGQLGPDWLAGGSPTPGVTSTLSHSGQYAALLGCQAAAWSTPWNIPNAPYASSFPNLAVDASGAVHALWAQAQPGLELFYSRRATNGVWSDPLNLASTPSLAAPPQVALDGSGVLHVAWADSSAGNSQVYYARRATDGTWTGPENISDSAGASDPPRMALDGGGALHVVWSELSGSDRAIYYARRATDGTWSAPLPISGAGTTVAAPQLAVDGGGAVHAVWTAAGSATTAVFYARRATDGTWSAPLEISQDAGPAAAPQVAADGSAAVHVAWATSSGSSDVFYARRSSGGSWSAPHNVSANDSASSAPLLAVESGGTAHVLWNDLGQAGKPDVYYARRATDGAWSSGQNVSQTAGNSSLQQVVNASGTIHMVWTEDSGDIYYARRESDGGWSLVHNASANSGASQAPRIAAEGYKTAHLVWTDTSPGIKAILYSQLASSAATANSSITQSITVPAGNAPTLWFIYLLDGASPTSGSWLSAQVDDGLHTTTLFSTTTAANTPAHHWSDMTPWAGQPVDLILTVHQTAGHICTWGYLDEVSVGSSYPDVWVRKGGTAEALPGEAVVYTIAYGNRGGAPAGGVQVSDFLPAALTLVAADPPPGGSGQNLVWDVGTLAGASGPFQIVLTATVAPTATAGGDLTNAAGIATTSPELETGNNQSTATTFIGQRVYLPLVLR